ncbi:MAG: DUF5908 family protein [Mariprofundus sp.]|nr:DUF5908 family protein [Mariprofundus sp.]
MPIEIRELVIKATVNESSGKRAAGKSGSEDSDQQQIVSECVQQVLDILQDRLER